MSQIYTAVRPQRGGLDESMRDCRWIKIDQPSLDKFFGREGCSVELYNGGGPDDRIGWPNTFIVLDKEGNGIGFASYWPVGEKV